MIRILTTADASGLTIPTEVPADLAPYREDPRALYLGYLRWVGGMDPLLGVYGPWVRQSDPWTGAPLDVWERSLDASRGIVTDARDAADARLLAEGFALLDEHHTMRAVVPEETP